VLAPAGSAAAQPSTWNFQQADVPAAQPMGDYGRGVLVAVVDSWVDVAQPQFGGRVVDEADCLSGTCRDRAYAPDSCVHGTHVAGTIASADYGVAPAADILAVQALSGAAGRPDPSANCTGSPDAVAAGIRFAVAKGARVVNLSLGDAVPGLFQSSAISDAVAAAAARGVVVVFAAGNQGVPMTDSYGNDALIVAATGPSGQLAAYSNFDTPVTGAVNVAAPGGDVGTAPKCTTANCILSTFPDRQIGLMQGTSMAAPHVSGVAALLLAQNPSRGRANVVAEIENTARPLGGAGSGLIDAAKALSVEAAAHPPSGTPPPPGSTAPAPGPTPTAGPPAPTGATGGASTAPAPYSGVPVTGGARVGAASGSAPSIAGVPGRAHPAKPGGVAAATRPANGGPATAPASAGTGLGRVVGNWAGRHKVVLVLACVLLAADILALLWTRESRRLFSGR